MKGKIYFSLVICLLLGFITNAQDNIRTYNFNKGEVVDWFLLNENNDKDDTAKRYFEKAIPIGIKNGYKPNKGFAVKDYQLDGNYKPEIVVLASWPSEENRLKCTEELESTLSDFHEMRRIIWSHFNVSYYVLSSDLSFSINTDKYNVATAYWINDDGSKEEFINKWKDLVIKSNGTINLELSDPKTTFRYTYQPNYQFITSWNSKEDFNKFKSSFLESEELGVEHINEFRLQ